MDLHGYALYLGKIIENVPIDELVTNNLYVLFSGFVVLHALQSALVDSDRNI